MNVAAIAEGLATKQRVQIAERLREYGGIDVEVHPGGIVASGQRLKARWLRDARLRWLGGWM